MKPLQNGTSNVMVHNPIYTQSGPLYESIQQELYSLTPDQARSGTQLQVEHLGNTRTVQNETRYFNQPSQIKVSDTQLSTPDLLRDDGYIQLCEHGAAKNAESDQVQSFSRSVPENKQQNVHHNISLVSDCKEHLSSQGMSAR